MRDALRGIVAGAIVLAVLGAIASRAGWIATDLPRPDGTGAWLLSRVTGVIALLALGLDVGFGLLVSTRVADRWLPRAATVELHGWLSPLALALVVAHAGVLLADRYIAFDALDVLVPFASPYRPVAVGLGVLAGYLAIVVHASFGLRKRIGAALWRRLHYLSFPAFLVASVHAIAAGSDAGRPAVVALYAVPLALVLALVAVRITRRRGAARAR